LIISEVVVHAAVVDAMNYKLEHTDDYEKMRKGVWPKARGQHSKRGFEERLLCCVGEILCGERVPTP
jgi:hypothetical protein